MFTSTLLNWFAKNARDLPWRHTTDPYAVWLSEIILQQTRIQQGHDYWLRFIRRWPQVEDLAAATEDQVLREWQGLGYYSRARNLHTAARQIVALGHFPNTLDTIRQLKGVGDYTAAAIASIAFGLPCAAVDGNVYRVLARHYGIDTPINTTQGKKLFTQLAQTLLPPDQPGTFNQAMMDFGAIRCTPQSPRCTQCPLNETCDALHTRRISQLPVKQKTLTVQTRRLRYLYLQCQGHTAIRRRPAGDIWQGLWEPLLLADDMASSLPIPQHTADTLQEKAILLRKDIRHILTHRILLADFYFLEQDDRPPLPPEYIWISTSQLNRYALPRLIQILLDAL
ncbi:MAG: A/G-specific adenine glycosylase [Bacteroidaceae bacterium]|nr:A/G-specific adenine glycosylase [Bacteroidaceae bacterium]